VVISKITGIEDLYAGVMVAIERRYCTWTPGVDRVGWVGKPYP
jgi:hypothetical protein